MARRGWEILGTFALALLHVATWVFAEMRLDLSRMAGQLADNPWLALGLAAFVLLLTLAATTPLPVVRKLGGASWQRLHRLVYVAAVLACLHYALRQGADPQHWIGFSLATCGLLWARVAHRGRKDGR